MKVVYFEPSFLNSSFIHNFLMSLMALFLYTLVILYTEDVCLFIMPLNLRGGKLKNTTIGGKLVTN